MTIITNRAARRAGIGFGAIAAASLLTLGVGAPAHAAFVTPHGPGHYDLVAELTCDDDNELIDVEVGLEEHTNNGHVSLGEDDYFVFDGAPDPQVGFAVEFDDNCIESEDEDGNPVPYPSAASVTFTLTGSSGPGTATGSDTTPTVIFNTAGGGAPNALTLNSGDYHEDLAWAFSVNGNYTLNFTATSGAFSDSGALQLQKS